MNSPSLKEPIWNSDDPCLLDADVGVELHGYQGLQQHCYGTTVPVVIILQKARMAVLLVFFSHKIICNRTDVNYSSSPRSILGYRIHKEVITLSYL
jgi:hypothetical protein